MADVRTVLGAAILGIATCAASASAAAEYTVIDLGMLPGYTSAYGARINNAGDVVGYVYDSGVNERAFVYRNGKMNDLGSGRAYDISGTGYIAGSIPGTLSNTTQAVLWQPGGAQTQLAGPSGFAAGNAVNSSGTVVGQVMLSSPTIHYAPLKWSNGQSVSLSALSGSASTELADINDAGQIVGGYVSSSGNLHAFRLTGETLDDLGSLGGNSKAFAISPNGTIAGASYLAGNTEARAVLFTASGPVSLGTLGGTRAEARDATDGGEVVGWSYIAGDVDQHAFRYADGKMVDLNALIDPASGWMLGAAFGVNDRGQISGTGSFNGERRAFLLTPVPEPAALIGLITTLGLVTLRRRRMA